MFGFLRGPHGDLDYRRAYARCCRFQRLAFGARTAPVVSYEGVFAYLLAREALGSGALPESEPTCCRLRGAGSIAGADDQRLGEFAAALGTLLAGIKLRDDVRDDHSLAARLALFVWRRPLKQAEAYFAQLDPAAPGRFREVVETHVALEASGRRYSLAEFARPTADGFGYAFSLLSRVDGRLAAHAGSFAEIGRAVGAAIIMADCATDWRRDQRRGLPNPVRGESAAREAVAAAQRTLAVAGYEWKRLAPSERSAVSRVLRAAIQRLDNANAPQERRATASAFGRVWPSRAARAGVCDCACDAACCDAGACADGGCAGAEVGADCCYWCGPCDWNWGEHRKPRNERPHSPLIGERGVTNGELSPNGIVIVGKRTFAARSETGRIPGGEKVVVVDGDELGLVVRPAGAERPSPE